MFKDNIERNPIRRVSLQTIMQWYLTTVLVLLPFQQKIIRIEKLSQGVTKFVSIIDELTIIVLFPLALITLYKNRQENSWLSLVLLFPIIFMCIVGLLSGKLNGNALMLSILGIFDYMKNFLVIFIFAAFFRDLRKSNKLFSIVLAVAVCIGLFGLVQEVWALIARYVLQKDIYDPGIYILRKAPKLIEEGWRAGIYRTASLMHNQNMFGLYSLLILCVYLCANKKINYLIFISLFTGVVVSVSKMVYAGFAILVALQIIRGRKWFVIFIIPLVFLLYDMSLHLVMFDNVSNSTEFNMLEDNEDSIVIEDVTRYREDSQNKAMEIWKDHPYFGVGPGMFGGNISVKYNSHLYEEYNFIYRSFLRQVKGIDQFWPQLMAETGIIGSVAFAGIIISLFLTLYLTRQEHTDCKERGILTALMMYILVIVIYGFGSGLNLSAVLFTYCAFIGVVVANKNGSFSECMGKLE